MSLTRSIFVAIATAFMVVAAPAAYAQVGYGYGQAGYGQAGCGGCGVAYTQAYAPIVYAQPIAPAQIYVGGCNTCAQPVTPVAMPSACCAVAPAPVACCAMPAPAPVAN